MLGSTDGLLRTLAKSLNP